MMTRDWYPYWNVSRRRRDAHGSRVAQDEFRKVMERLDRGVTPEEMAAAKALINAPRQARQTSLPFGQRGKHD